MIAVRQSLTDIFMTNRKPLMWRVMSIVGDPQTAEDIIQEAYVQVRKALEGGPIQHLEAFLYVTARNLALNHKRRQKMRGRFEVENTDDAELAQVPSAVPSQESSLIQRQRLQSITDAIARLPQRTQTAWMLSHIEKWPHTKIAEHLGVSAHTVFNDLKKAHAVCLEALAKVDR